MKRIKDNPECVDEPDDCGKTPLMWAVEKGRVSIVTELLKSKRVKIDSIDDDGWSALLFAARRGNCAICDMLLNVGAEISICTKDDNFSALHLACGNELIDMSKLLINAGIDYNIKDVSGRIASQYIKSKRNGIIMSTYISQAIEANRNPQQLSRKREEDVAEKLASESLEKYMQV